MEIIKNFINYFLHLDHSISVVTAHWGPWTYVILFVLIFCETGLVVTPFYREIPCFLLWGRSLPTEIYN